MKCKPWVGASAAHRELLELIERVARTGVEILISGETGVGKEQYARHVHACGARGDGPFVPVNCGSIPGELFENELFGHVAGAFTGARPRAAGLVAAAKGGTLFLDEIDALSLPNQVKLLRLVQEREFRRLGDTQAQRADLHIVTATNRDLVQAVREGRFRDDLLFRLRVVPLVVPPLRDRRDDVLPLLDAFVAWYAGEYAAAPIRFTPAARDALEQYGWPGNIRELENVVRNLTCVSPGALIDTPQLPLIEARGSRAIPVGSFRGAKSAVVESFERKFIEDALAASGGNITRAARSAGKPRRAFFELMRKYGVVAPRR